MKFAGIVHVLHAFQKAKQGRETPDSEMAIVRRRLKVAADDYKRLTEGKSP